MLGTANNHLTHALQFGAFFFKKRVAKQHPDIYICNTFNQGDEMNIQETLNQREATHGEFDSVARIAQEIKLSIRSAVLDIKNKPLSIGDAEALDMIASKIARIVCGNADEPDHWHDIAGYATLRVNAKMLKRGVAK